MCTGYKCPASLDPRLLDPAHVFRQIEVDQPDKKPSIFDKVGYVVVVDVCYIPFR